MMLMQRRPIHSREYSGRTLSHALVVVVERVSPPVLLHLGLGQEVKELDVSVELVLVQRFTPLVLHIVVVLVGPAHGGAKRSRLAHLERVLTLRARRSRHVARGRSFRLDAETLGVN